MLRKTVPVLAVGALLTLAACGNQAGGAHTAKDGVKMGPGVTDSEIRVGILSDFSGPIAEAATAGSLGTEVKFDAVNAAGGICGRKIVAVKGDTKYDPQQTTQAYRSTANNIVMISQILGTASLLAVKDSIERDGDADPGDLAQHPDAADEGRLRAGADLRGRADERPRLGRQGGAAPAPSTRSRSAWPPRPTRTATSTPTRSRAPRRPRRVSRSSRA